MWMMTSSRSVTAPPALSGVRKPNPQVLKICENDAEKQQTISSSGFSLGSILGSLGGSIGSGEGEGGHGYYGGRGGDRLATLKNPS
jgi:hypothetical protein